MLTYGELRPEGKHDFLKVVFLALIYFLTYGYFFVFSLVLLDNFLYLVGFKSTLTLFLLVWFKDMNQYKLRVFMSL